MAVLHFVIAASAVLAQRVAAVATKAPHAAQSTRVMSVELSRRSLLALATGAMPLTPLRARAGRVEDMLATDTATMLEDPANAVRGPVARTVQTSKLGVAVRRAVVKSAQFDDALDARWDALSYKLRPKQAPPAPRPPPKPVDLAFAEATRRCGIDCCAAARVSPRAVEDAIAAGRDTYASLYEGKSAFGLETYAAFRAFNSFLKDDAAAARFEAALGTALLDGPYSSARPARPAHATQKDLESAIAGCVDILKISKGANLCGGLDVSPPDAEDLADLASRKAWGDENKDVQNPAPQLQLSAKLIDAAELPPRLMLETQAKRLGLRVLPDATASALRAYLLRCGARPVCEEYFVDDVYRTAFDKDDYSTVQLEVLIN
jgi:hypothetical protein